MILIERATADESSLREGLVALLQDCVDNGASVGFLAPLKAETARRYWEGIFAALDDNLTLWTATDNGRVVGSVQLSRCGKENGRHRAEVQKLFVLTSHRGQGIASRLMETLETFARAQGITLLTLDTEAGSGAESLYQRLSYQRVGEIPDYAANPDGELHATALYFKILSPA